MMLIFGWPISLISIIWTTSSLMTATFVVFAWLGFLAGVLLLIGIWKSVPKLVLSAMVFMVGDYFPYKNNCLPPGSGKILLKIKIKNQLLDTRCCCYNSSYNRDCNYVLCEWLRQQFQYKCEL